MGFKMGIVGLPNVGKSTLFNALTKTAAAQAANFPFCTIEPNVGEVGVPDARLDTLAGIAGSKEIIPTRMTFVDIAGLVKGASRGEGLGNRFLANIRETDAIAHVLRCFEGGDVTRAEGRVDPVSDAETIETELMLADIESLEKRLQNVGRKVRGGDKEAVRQERLMKEALAVLENGQPARVVEVAGDDLEAWKMLHLLTTKRRRDGGWPGKFTRRYFSPDRSRDQPAGTRGTRDVPGRNGAGRTGPGSVDPGGVRIAAPRDVFHRRAEGGARMDDSPGDKRAQGRRRDPRRFRKRLYPRRNYRV